jgi:hypothetical protein
MTYLLYNFAFTVNELECAITLERVR